MGPNALIAPFMDDLDDNVGTEPFKVYSYLDIENDQLIIQWDNVANGEDDEFCGTEQDCTRETFQLILKVLMRFFIPANIILYEAFCVYFLLNSFPSIPPDHHYFFQEQFLLNRQ